MKLLQNAVLRQKPNNKPFSLSAAVQLSAADSIKHLSLMEGDGSYLTIAAQIKSRSARIDSKFYCDQSCGDME